jgi:hypothetical protein
MKVNKINSTILFFAIFCSLLVPSKSFADWAYSFVVYDGYVYVISDEHVIDIGKEIGQVTKYSDREGSYYGNFSNTYEEGTKYYSINGISTGTAIAVDDHGTYIKAIRDGVYAGSKYNPIFIVIGGVFLFVIITFLIFIVQKKVTSSKSS